MPEFQALPSSISAQQLVQPTKVEYFPKDQLPKVDLKGHTVEELAAIAGVSEEYIRIAIKIRQQQMMKDRMAVKVNATTTETSVTDKISVTPTSTIAESTTTEFVFKKKDSPAKPYVPKKKSVAKKVSKLGQKVKDIYTYFVR